MQVVAVFDQPDGSNGRLRLVAICSDDDAYQRWVASDEYVIEPVERKASNVRGSHILYVKWNGIWVGTAFSQPEARRAIERHREGRNSRYRTQSWTVFE